MKIAIKYCGGCNPRIRRKEIVQKVKEKCTPLCFEIFNPEKQYDLILALNGCHVACGISDNIKKDKETIVVGGLNIDGQKLKSETKLIGKIIKRIINEYKKEGINNELER